METGSWFSVMNLVLVVAGAALGAAAGHFLSPSIGEAKRLRDELDRMLREHETYKASVDAHFRKTADLVGQMTKSYAAVYDHLAGGARTFCDDSGPGNKLPFEPLPGALASPVVETSGDEIAAADADDAAQSGMEALEPTTAELPASDWPTDVVLDDAADRFDENAGDESVGDESAGDENAADENAGDEPADSRDSKAVTTNFPS